MGAYTVEFRVTIEADNSRDAYDSLIAWLEAGADMARVCGIVVPPPAFEDVRYSA